MLIQQEQMVLHLQIEQIIRWKESSYLDKNIRCKIDLKHAVIKQTKIDRK